MGFEPIPKRDGQFRCKEASFGAESVEADEVRVVGVWSDEGMSIVASGSNCSALLDDFWRIVERSCGLREPGSKSFDELFFGLDATGGSRIGIRRVAIVGSAEQCGTVCEGNEPGIFVDNGVGRGKVAVRWGDDFEDISTSGVKIEGREPVVGKSTGT